MLQSTLSILNAMNYHSITMQYNYGKSRRITVGLDQTVIKKLKDLQSKLIKAENRKISLSEVLELVLREKLKM